MQTSTDLIIPNRKLNMINGPNSIAGSFPELHTLIGAVDGFYDDYEPTKAGRATPILWMSISATGM